MSEDRAITMILPEGEDEEYSNPSLVSLITSSYLSSIHSYSSCFLLIIPFCYSSMENRDFEIPVKKLIGFFSKLWIVSFHQLGCVKIRDVLFIWWCVYRIPTTVSSIDGEASSISILAEGSSRESSYWGTVVSYRLMTMRGIEGNWENDARSMEKSIQSELCSSFDWIFVLICWCYQ